MHTPLVVTVQQNTDTKPSLVRSDSAEPSHLNGCGGFFAQHKECNHYHFS